MKIADILSHRLVNQQIATSRFTHPQEIVAWMGAMQAQEYAMAKWAIGLRLRGFDDAGVENAFNLGEILRTHCMRPTWHFVTPADIRWIQALTAPRVHAISAYYFRKMNLDRAVFKRSHAVLASALEGGRQLTRVLLKEALQQAGIEADGLRLAYLLIAAELDGIICSGAREGKQFTYALLDERAPRSGARNLDTRQALMELTRIYFTSRGPATMQDFMWWSGLSMLQVKEGVALLGSAIVTEVVEGREYLLMADLQAGGKKSRLSSGHTTFLMPDYDEYGISYKERSVLFLDTNNNSGESKKSTAYSHMIVVDGRIAGTWERSMEKGRLVVETVPFNTLSGRQQQSLLKAVQRYISFFEQKRLHRKMARNKT